VRAWLRARAAMREREADLEEERRRVAIYI
jgi:hypothetical protein